MGRGNRWRWGAAAGATFLALAALPVWALASGPASLKPVISRAYPAVEWVSVPDAARWLERGQAILFDVRAEAEYRVSRIPGAIRVDPGGKLPEIRPSDRKVVVYCSVGWRSGDLAARLHRQGVTAYNLTGGIFEWANRGRPLVNDAGPTRWVHPYDWTWGRLLVASRRAPLPNPPSSRPPSDSGPALGNDGPPRPNP